MISAGLVLTKMVGASVVVTTRPGMLLRMSAKFGSPASLANPSGSLPAGWNGPENAGATSHTPLFSRYHRPPPAGSCITSQLVFTANDRPLLPAGARTGSPSNTTRLAGRSL